MSTEPPPMNEPRHAPSWKELMDTPCSLDVLLHLTAVQVAIVVLIFAVAVLAH